MAVSIRSATPDDAGAIVEIVTPIIVGTTISFELEPPLVDEMRGRIAETLQRFPWLVSLDDSAQVNGYASASVHRPPPAYGWSANTSIYLREDARGRGVGKALYGELFARLAAQGYFQAFAGIALPNSASVALHESVGFRKIGVYEKVGFKHGAWRDVGWWQRSLRGDDALRGEPPPVAAAASLPTPAAGLLDRSKGC